MKKVIGIILVCLAIYLGYIGVIGFAESTESVNFLGIELTAQDSDAKTTSIVFIVFAILSFLGGVTLLKGK